jgi:hypothetical protein
MSGRAYERVLHQVVSEPDSCLYISGEGGIRGKEYSDMHQVVSEPDYFLYISGEGGTRGKEYSDMHQVVSEHRKILCFL